MANEYLEVSPFLSSVDTEGSPKVGESLFFKEVLWQFQSVENRKHDEIHDDLKIQKLRLLQNRCVLNVAGRNSPTVFVSTVVFIKVAKLSPSSRPHPMADSHIEKRVREIIADQLGIADEDISPQSSFHHDLGADSLDLVELYMALEEEFEIDIPPEVTDELSTVADIIRYIERQPN